jgi:hypothetical protein
LAFVLTPDTSVKQPKCKKRPDLWSFAMFRLATAGNMSFWHGSVESITGRELPKWHWLRFWGFMPIAQFLHKHCNY